MSFPHPAVTEMLRVWTQNRTNFAHICLVTRYLTILNEVAVKRIQNRTDLTDGVSDCSTRIRTNKRSYWKDFSVHLNEIEFYSSWTPSRCQRKIRFGQGQFIAGQSVRNAAIHDRRNFHSGRIFLQLTERLYSTAPINTFSGHTARGPTTGNWH